VSSDRIKPAPVSDPEPRNREDPIDETARPVAAEDDDEEEEGYEGAPMDDFLFERITGMKKHNDGTLRYKVRWYGYGPRTPPANPALTYPPHPYAAIIAG
jgi:hypothetical protein